MDMDLQQAAEQEAQEQAREQPENQPQEAAEPQSMAEAMFGETESDAAAGAEAGAADAETPAEGVADDPAAPAEAKDDDLTAPDGLGEKASARFQALANEVKEWRAKDAEYRAMAETVQEFRTLAQESCNNSEEVVQLFDYARAVKTGDFDKVEQYLHRQIMQFEALSGRRIQPDLLGQYPDIVQRMENLGLDAESAHELARNRWQQQQQQAYLQQQQAAQQAQWQQQQAEEAAQLQRQQVFDQAVQDVNELSRKFAKTDVLWPEHEPKVLAFARSQLPNVPPEQWVFALQSFYDGLKQAAAVRQNVPPLRGGAPAGGQAEPQNLQEAMFGGV